MIVVKEIVEERGIDEEDVHELLALFIDYTRTEDLAPLREALRAGDYSVARDRAHSIKGAALNLKLTEIASLARKIEEKCDVGDLEGVDELVASVADELQMIDAFLKQLH